MDIQPVTQQGPSDDQEIAKVLAGVNEQIQKDQAATPSLNFEETPPAAPPVDPAAPAPAGPALPQVPTTPAADPVVAPPVPAPTSPTPAASADDAATDPALEGIKKDALSELRPLVDKLNVSPEEKFDTYLLLIRSTDDKSLLGPAHEAAKGITDDARRAQALLDVIKEIDYLSHAQQA